MARKKTPTMSRNGTGPDLKIAVLAEQMKTIGEDLREHRNDTRQFREDVRKDIATLRTEVVGRMDRHEENDQRNFKAIDDRMVMADKATATREAAAEAVSKYKKWQWTLIAGATATIVWNVLRFAEPLLHQILGGK